MKPIPVFNRNGIRLYCSDNVDLMKKMLPNRIDLTVTSPPYDNLRTYTGKSKWTREKFLAVAYELYRVTKAGGAVVWVVNDQTVNWSETGSSFWQALQFMKIGFNLADTMIWIKEGGGASGNDRMYTQNFEYMFLLSKGRLSTSNLIKDRANVTAGRETRRAGLTRRRGKYDKHIDRDRPGEYRKEYGRRNNYWLMARPFNGGEHPAVFPKELARDHILSWSNPGDTIFDPFNGSGTTMEQAYLLGRNAIGIDEAETYCDISITRLTKAMKGGRHGKA